MLQLDNERRACIVFNAWNLIPESAAEERCITGLTKLAFTTSDPSFSSSFTLYAI